MSIIVVGDAGTWKRRLREISGFDTYHTYAYHRLAERNGEGTPLLLIHENKDLTIALPMLRRDIPGHPGLYDLTSVYGYPGPVASRASVTFDEAILFRQDLHTYFVSERVVSAFTRLNPLIANQASILSGIGTTTPTVVLDLASPDTSEYSKTLRYDLRRLAREGYETCWTKSWADVESFREVYLQNMRRVGAEERYFFSSEYFRLLFASDEYNCELALARKDNAVVAGSIFLTCGNIVQYHLSATDEAHMRMSPVKLILDAARAKYAQAGFRWLHLGGGVGGRIDSLFQFKRSFSAQVLAFGVWRYVPDPERYNALVQSAGLAGNPRFPAYRK